jgi:hypothetical protein
LVKKYWIPFILSFTLALIARESALILVPGLILIFILTESSFKFSDFFARKRISNLLYILLPVGLYFIFLSLYLSHFGLEASTEKDFSQRFDHFDLNLGNSTYAVETFISFFVELGAPLYFTFHFLQKKSPISPERMKYIRAFLLTVVLNSIVVVLTTKAREVRLFIIPLFFLWPIFGQLFVEELKLLIRPKLYWQTFTKWPYLLFFIFLNFFNYFLSFKIYVLTLGFHSENYFGEYLFIMNSIIITHLLINLRLKRSAEVITNSLKTEN